MLPCGSRSSVVQIASDRSRLRLMNPRSSMPLTAGITVTGDADARAAIGGFVGGRRLRLGGLADLSGVHTSAGGVRRCGAGAGSVARVQDQLHYITAADATTAKVAAIQAESAAALTATGDPIYRLASALPRTALDGARRSSPSQQTHARSSQTSSQGVGPRGRWGRHGAGTGTRRRPGVVGADTDTGQRRDIAGSRLGRSTVGHRGGGAAGCWGGCCSPSGR